MLLLKTNNILMSVIVMVDYEVICDEIHSNGLEDTLIKYNCSLNDLFNYCLHKHFLTGVKSNSDKRSCTVKYIQKQYDGKYRIRKSVKGKLVYFGYYENLNDAIRVRDRLIELGWKRYLLDKVCEELGVSYK